MLFLVFLMILACCEMEKIKRPDYSRVNGDYFGNAIYTSEYLQDTISINVTVLPLGEHYSINFELNGTQEVMIGPCIPYEFPHEYLFFSFLDNQDIIQKSCGTYENRFAIPFDQNDFSKVNLYFKLQIHNPDSVFSLAYHGEQLH